MDHILGAAKEHEDDAERPSVLVSLVRGRQAWLHGLGLKSGVKFSSAACYTTSANRRKKSAASQQKDPLYTEKIDDLDSHDVLYVYPEWGHVLLTRLRTKCTHGGNISIIGSVATKYQSSDTYTVASLDPVFGMHMHTCDAPTSTKQRALMYCLTHSIRY